VLLYVQISSLRAVSRNSDFMLRLITDLLQISRIEAGKLQLDVQPAEIVDVVRKNVQLNQLVAQQKEIELRLSCGSGPGNTSGGDGPVCSSRSKR
jgi:signal transduction histidine kinase